MIIDLKLNTKMIQFIMVIYQTYSFLISNNDPDRALKAFENSMQLCKKNSMSKFWLTEALSLSDLADEDLSISDFTNI